MYEIPSEINLKKKSEYWRHHYWLYVMHRNGYQSGIDISGWRQSSSNVLLVDVV